MSCRIGRWSGATLAMRQTEGDDSMKEPLKCNCGHPHRSSTIGPEDYLNLHQNCFHIWQTPVAWEVQ